MARTSRARPRRHRGSRVRSAALSATSVSGRQRPWILWIDADMVLAPRRCRLRWRGGGRRRRPRPARSSPSARVLDRLSGAGALLLCRRPEPGQPAVVAARAVARPRRVRPGDCRTGGHRSPAAPAAPDPAALARTADRPRRGPADAAHVLPKRAYYGRCLPAFAAKNPGALAGQALALSVPSSGTGAGSPADPAHTGGLLRCGRRGRRVRRGQSPGAPPMRRRLLWVSLADQRPGREQRWLSLLPAPG